MNKRQKDVLQHQIYGEKTVLAELEKQYRKALNDINRKIRILESDELTQSRIYRLEYQKALRAQVEAILEKLHADEYSTIQQFLSASYTDGFLGTLYDLHGQGVPLVFPVDPKEAVRAVLTESKISLGLYEALGVDIAKLTRTISSEITRGIASDLAYTDIARNISNASKAPFSRAKTIVQTESHRIQQASTLDAQRKAKSRGADVVKQWNSTLDGDTRPTHRKLDGQIREVDEPFAANGDKAMYPGGFGDPAEDCNCRCVSLTRAKWALGDDELNTLKARAEFFGLDKAEDFDDFKKKYMQLERKGLAAKISGDGIPEHEAPVFVKSVDYSNKKAVMAEITRFEKAMVNNTVETACVITKEGRVYLCSGVKDRVFPDFDLKDEIKGATISHNHPITETAFSFSDDDLDLFLAYNLDVMRGCDQRYTYEFTRNAENIDVIDDMDIDIDDLSEETYFHMHMIKMAQKYGIGYRRWKND